jgi:hypothetical protein
MLKDKELQMALVYFMMLEDITVRGYSVEMIFSRGYSNHWNLDSGSWEKLTVFEINLN